MKKYILLFLSFFLSLTISACVAQDSPVPAPAETARTESGENVREKGEALMRIQITANGRTWQAELEDSPAARALAAKMPLTLSMRDLYGRELCCRLGAGALPVSALHSDGYAVGDIAYCPPMGSLVILYAQNGEHFERQHLGRVLGDLDGLAASGDTDVTFAAAE